jgi:uncharacterized membrane-anchored protein
MELKKTFLYKFIKEYPRISFLILLLILIFILVLPISLENKIMLPIRALIIGFIIAAAVWYFKLTKQKSR